LFEEIGSICGERKMLYSTMIFGLSICAGLSHHPQPQMGSLPRHHHQADPDRLGNKDPGKYCPPGHNYPPFFTYISHSPQPLSFFILINQISNLHFPPTTTMGKTQEIMGKKQ